MPCNLEWRKFEQLQRYAHPKAPLNASPYTCGVAFELPLFHVLISQCRWQMKNRRDEFAAWGLPLFSCRAAVAEKERKNIKFNNEIIKPPTTRTQMEGGNNGPTSKELLFCSGDEGR
jgi:hypothetical protein